MQEARVDGSGGISKRTRLIHEAIMLLQYRECVFEKAFVHDKYRFLPFHSHV
jgi:hypothetical protein